MTRTVQFREWLEAKRVREEREARRARWGRVAEGVGMLVLLTAAVALLWW